MISKNELKRNRLLNHLTDEMLEKLAAVTHVVTYKNRDVVFRSGAIADYLYMVKKGKVLLEQRISPKVTVSVASIPLGHSFGWGTILGEALYSLDSICVEPCEFYAISGETLRSLMAEDHEMGYLIMRQFILVVKSRLDRRTEQFLRVMATHPDIQDFKEVETV